MKEGEDKEDAVPAHKSHGLERDRQTTSTESAQRDTELSGQRRHDSRWLGGEARPGSPGAESPEGR